MKFEDAFSFESLLKAHRQCRLSKQHKRDVITYELNLGINLIKTSRILLDGSYVVGKYKEFKIYDPKERLVEALPYRDRVVLMAFCTNIIEPVLERKLIYDNVACRKGKGTLFGMKRLEGFLKKYYKKHGKQGYALKCDITKYFQNINHKVLINKLHKVGFEKQELNLMTEIIESKGGNEVGLPIGNQTSQWFALLYLDDIDRLIKEKLQIKYYVRYIDDFILVHHDKEYLKYCRSEIEKLANEKLKLTLNKKTQIVKLKNGIDFLGFRHILCDNGKVIRLLRGKAKTRLKRKLKVLNILSQKQDADKVYIRQSLNAHKAHVMYSKSKRMLDKEIIKKNLDNY